MEGGFSSISVENPEGREKLPRHLAKDGAKWLIIPSKVILASLSVWPENQNTLNKIMNVIYLVSGVCSSLGNVYYMGQKNIDMGSITYSLLFCIINIEGIARRGLANLYVKRLIKVLSIIYYDFWPASMMGKPLEEELAKGSLYLFVYCSLYTFSAFTTIVQIVVFPYLRGHTPIKTAYPFDWEKSPYFEIIYIWESIRMYEVLFMVCGNDFFFVSLLFNCIAQYKLLRTYFVTRYGEILRFSPNKAVDVRKLTRECIKRHKMLMRTCEEINQVFTYFILIQFLSSIASVCLCSFIVTAVPENMSQVFPTLMGHLCEIFIYCYMGNDLIIESTELSNAVYQCGWNLIQTDIDLQKSLMMIMVRSQKPVRISAGGFGFLSLSSFLKLIQFSFSVYTLLTSMMDKREAQGSAHIV